MRSGLCETAFGKGFVTCSFWQNACGTRRAAINAPMQGTAADIMKLAMINMHDYIKGTGKDIHLILQVHDSYR